MDPGWDTDLSKYVLQRKVLAIIPMFSAFASVVGSGYIVYTLVSTKRVRDNKLKKSTFYRILLALSISDILASSAQLFSTWAYPSNISISSGVGVTAVTSDNDQILLFSTEKQIFYHALFPYTAGNDTTCTIQGFFVHFGLLSSICCNGFIAIQYVLTVTFRWKEKRLQILGTIFLILTYIVSLSMAIFLVVIGAIGPLKEGFCWISVKPIFCDPPWDDECQNLNPGMLSFWEKLNTYRFYMATLWIATVCCIDILSMIILFFTVRSTETKAARWSDNANQGKQQKQVVKTALLYIGAFLLVWIPPIVALYKHPNFATHIFIAIILPLQGCINALIFSKTIDKLCTKCLNAFLYCFGCTGSDNHHLLRQSSSSLPYNNNNSSSSRSSNRSSSSSISFGLFSNLQSKLQSFRSLSTMILSTKSRRDVTISNSTSEEVEMWTTTTTKTGNNNNNNQDEEAIIIPGQFTSKTNQLLLSSTDPNIGPTTKKQTAVATKTISNFDLNVDDGDDDDDDSEQPTSKSRKMELENQDSNNNNDPLGSNKNRHHQTTKDDATGGDIFDDEDHNENNVEQSTLKSFSKVKDDYSYRTARNYQSAIDYDHEDEGVEALDVADEIFVDDVCHSDRSKLQKSFCNRGSGSAKVIMTLPPSTSSSLRKGGGILHSPRSKYHPTSYFNAEHDGGGGAQTIISKKNKRVSFFGDDDNNIVPSHKRAEF